jgi:hypothetical protein
MKQPLFNLSVSFADSLQPSARFEFAVSILGACARMKLGKVKNVFESMIRDEEHHRESWLQQETALVKSQRNRIARQKLSIKIQTLGPTPCLQQPMSALC